MGKLLIKRLREDAVMPKRATDGSAGYDLCACIDAPVVLPAGGRELIPTGIAVATPDPSTVALVFGRSGLGTKHGIVPANAVGVVDMDYRGEVMVGLSNHSGTDYTLQPGERIAQLVLVPVLTPEVEECDHLPETGRGSGGFGSTGR